MAGRRRETDKLRPLLEAASFVLVIQVDACLVRERDDWGVTARLRDAREDFSRRHWVYAATIFRLDARGRTPSSRSTAPDEKDGGIFSSPTRLDTCLHAT